MWGRSVMDDADKQPSWEPCPLCGAPMVDDDGCSWPYCPICPWPEDEE